MHSPILISIIVALAALNLGGCATRVGSMTAFSTKNVEFANFEKARPDAKRGRSETNGSYLLFNFIPVKFGNDVIRITNDLLEREQGDLLINANVDRTLMVIPFILTYDGLTVTGDVVDTARFGKRE